jgi:ankyrin repeat protein
MPNPTIDHKKLLQYMQSLGYQIDPAGMCFGFAHMAMHAILLPDGIEAYNRRLKVLSEIPREALALRIESLRKADIEKIEKYKLQNILRKKITQLLEQSHSQDEEDILSIPAFFEGVDVYFQPQEHPDLFAKGATRPLLQNAELTFPRVLPQALEGKVKKAGSFSGIYTLKELETYFTRVREMLKGKADQQPVCFILGSLHHTVAIGFDPHKQCWLWINSGFAKEIPFNEIDQITATVMGAFSTNGITAFETEVYVKEPSNGFEEFVNTLTQAPLWEALHSVTEEKAKRCDSKGSTWLCVAAKHGHLDRVDSLLNNGADPNKTAIERVPLIIAANSNHLPIVEHLLAAGADPKKTLTCGTTALHYAAANKNVAMARCLLEAKADPNKAITTTGATALHIAILEGDTLMAKTFLGYQANIEAKFKYPCEKNNVPDTVELTALHLAVVYEHADLVALLIEHGANIDAALHFAKNQNIIKMLQEKQEKQFNNIQIKISKELQAEMDDFKARKKNRTAEDELRCRVVEDLKNSIMAITMDFIQAIKNNENYNTLKSQYAEKLRNAIKSSLINNKLDKYQWLQKIGICLLNLLSFLIFPTLIIKRIKTGSYFYSTTGKSKEAVEKTGKLVHEWSHQL